MTTCFSWFEKIKNAKKTMIVQDGIKKFHYLFPDDLEMVEEYDKENLTARKWKQKSTLGGDGLWTFEIGEPSSHTSNQLTENLMECYQNPKFSRCDTDRAFQWRVRNLPYPSSVYSLTVQDEKEIILRTSNKKYYRKFEIPDMKRLNLNLDQRAISYTHGNNTLIISYKKPAEILEQEKLVKQHLQTIKPVDKEQSDCKTS